MVLEENVGDIILSTFQALPPLGADFDYVGCASEGWVLNNPCTECRIVTEPFKEVFLDVPVSEAF